MMESKISGEDSKKPRLCELVKRLSTIILSNALEQKDLLALPPAVPLSPVESMANLRRVSMRCAQLREASVCCAQVGHDCGNTQTGLALGRLSADLASVAEDLAALAGRPGRR
jgi:hypothetical protein